MQERQRKQEKQEKQEKQNTDRMGRRYGEDRQESRGMAQYWQEARGVIPDGGRRQEALAAISGAIKRKRIRYTPSVWEVLWIEIKYISPFFWIVQGGMAAAVFALIKGTVSDSGGLITGLRWGSIAAALMGVFICGSLGKHLSVGMAELEQSCYLDLPQLWTMKMVFTGSVDILLLFLFSGEIARSTQTLCGQICVYLLVPFVLSNVCCMLVMMHVRGSRGRYGRLVVAFLAGAAAALPPALPQIYELEYLWVWGVLMAAGMGILAGQVRHMLKGFVKGEVLCWN